MEFCCKVTMIHAMNMKTVHLRLILALLISFCFSYKSYAARPTIRLLQDTAFLEPYDSLIPPVLAQNDVGDSIPVIRIGFVDTAHLGTYIIKVYALDTLKRSSDTLKLVVVVHDLIPPVLTLTGPTDITLQKGQPFLEHGYIVSDNYDSMPYVFIGGSFVNTSATGIFLRSYQAMDNSGNRSQILTRKITVIDTTSGIEEFYTTPVQLHTYPNPCAGTAWLEAGNEQPQKMELALYDILGRKQNTIAEGIFSKTIFPVNVSQLPNGNYFILGKIGTTNVCAKVVVAR